MVKESSICGNSAGDAALASLESCLALSGGAAPVPLSAQQLLDCSLGLQADVGTQLERVNRGCADNGGGFVDIFFKYVMQRGGELQTEEEYPRKPDREAGECSLSPSPPPGRPRTMGAKMVDYEYKIFADEELLKSWLQYGPVTSNVVVTPAWEFYAGGIYYNEECVNYALERVPRDCSTRDGGYTCLGDCSSKMPAHCDRFTVPLTDSHIKTQLHLLFNIEGYSSKKCIKVFTYLKKLAKHQTYDCLKVDFKKVTFAAF